MDDLMETRTIPALASALLLLGCATPRPATFATPEEAVHRLMVAAEDDGAAEELLGAGGFSLLRSGDDVADRADIDAVAALVREQLTFEDLGQGRKLALLGRERWELPIPLVQEAGAWRFDVDAGREEVLNRRIGRNELSTIATLRELAEAQREYAAEGHDGKPPAYARRLLSSAGRHDGLYWPTAEGEAPSPLGPLVAEASREGYGGGDAQPNPYHGYLYRLLTAQGKNAPGGARSYLDGKGQLTGGFAVVAWPTTYDNSGVMTFLVNQQGIVFQKDLGPDTGRVVESIQAYDPDASWTPTGD
jgi:hypothetical protein